MRHAETAGIITKNTRFLDTTHFHRLEAPPAAGANGSTQPLAALLFPGQGSQYVTWQANDDHPYGFYMDLYGLIPMDPHLEDESELDPRIDRTAQSVSRSIKESFLSVLGPMYTVEDGWAF